MDLEGVRSWQDVAAKYNISEIRAVGDEVRRQSNDKTAQLRQLIGDKFQDLLRTANTIIDMETLTETHSADLTQLYISQKRFQWEKTISNVTAFDNPTRHPGLSEKAARTLFKKLDACIERQLRNPKSYTVLAKEVYLAGLLCGKSARSAERYEQLHAMFMESLTGSLLENEDIRSSSCLDLVIAYTIVLSCSCEDAFQKFLSTRMALVKSCLELKSVEAFLKALLLISSTIQIYDGAFSRQQAKKAIDQQATFHSLLETPDIVQLVELELDIVKQWLPTEVTSVRSVPAGCLSPPSDRVPSSDLKAFISESIVQLGAATVNVLSECHEPAALQNFYKELILLMKDHPSLRSLSGKPESWIFTTFHKLWSERLFAVMDSVIGNYKAITTELTRMHKELTEGNVRIFGNENIFKNHDLFRDFSRAGATSDLFRQIQRSNKGAVGSATEFSDLLDKWYTDVSSWKSEISKASKLSSLIASSDATAAFGENGSYTDDYEEYQAWKEEGSQKVHDFSSKALKKLEVDVGTMYDNLKSEISELCKAQKNTTHSVVYALKSLSILHSTIEKLDMRSGLDIADISEEGFQTLCHLLDLKQLHLTKDDYENLSIASWTLSKEEEGSIIYPTNASNMLISRLLDFNNTCTSIIGKDLSVWNMPGGIKLIRKTMSEALNQSTLQVLQTISAEVEVEGNRGHNAEQKETGNKAKKSKRGLKKEKISSMTDNDGSDSPNTQERAEQKEKGPEAEEDIQQEDARRRATIEESDEDEKDYAGTEENIKEGSANDIDNGSNEKNSQSQYKLLQLYADTSYINSFFSQALPDSFAQQEIWATIPEKILKHIAARSSELVDSNALLLQPFGPTRMIS